MKNKINLFLIIGIGLFLIIGCKSAIENTKTAPVSNNAPAAEKTAAPESVPTVATKDASAGVTAANFAKIKTGMKYADVVKILGAEGELLSENEIGGYKTEMFQWKAGIMSNMNAVFQNGKLVSKSQFGLE